MKLATIAATGVVLAVSGPMARGFPQEREKPATASEPGPLAPGPHHEHLTQLVGVFDAVGRMPAEAGKPAEEWKASETRAMGCRGLCLLWNVDGELAGKTFTGHGVLGYDTVRKQHFLTWMDNWSGTCTTMAGACAKEGKTLTLSGTVTDPAGKPVKQQLVIEVDDEEHQRYALSMEGPDGKMRPGLAVALVRNRKATASAPSAPPAAGEPRGAADPAEGMARATKAREEWAQRAASVGRDSPERAALLRDLRENLRGQDPDLAVAAAETLEMLARRELLRPDEAAELRKDFGAMPAGAPARPHLAAAVAAGLASGPDLAPFLGELPREAEPEVRGQVLRVLDHSPGEPFREFILRLSAEEKDPSVLRTAWDDRRIGAACTRESAPRIVAAIEPRLARGDLPAEIGGRGYTALALAGVQSPSEAAAALARLVRTEKSPELARYGAELERLLASGQANASSVESLWKRNRRGLR